VEQLQEEIATLIGSQELSKTEIARLQNLLGSASHKVADLEFQVCFFFMNFRFIHHGLVKRVFVFIS